MSKKELDIHIVLKELEQKYITQTVASKKLNLSTRQMRRLQKRFREEGVVGLIHKGRGKASNRSLDEDTKTRIQEKLTTTYKTFGPTFATEKLLEFENITVSKETVRQLMIESKVWTPHKEKSPTHRAWRERREFYGELIQYDGSSHDWFAGRLPKHMLLASIDDATGNIMHLRFDESEGVLPTARHWIEYMHIHGKPRSIYLDKGSTYKINHKELRDNPAAKTQFEISLDTLNITLIHAHSPQAKGRIERLFATLQDRLPKELTLRHVSDVEEANIWLQDEFIPKYNTQFSVVPRGQGDLHRRLTLHEQKHIMRICAEKTERIVANDFTVRHGGLLYQLEKKQPIILRTRDKVYVETWIDGSMHISKKDTDLVYEEISKKRPEKIVSLMNELVKKTTVPQKPPSDHPWRTFNITTSKRNY